MIELEEAIGQLEHKGFCHLHRVYEPSQIREALELVRHWYEKSLQTCEKVPFPNFDRPTVYNLQNKDIFFLNMLFGTRALPEILIHFLNDVWFREIPQTEPNYLLRSFIARSSNKRLPMYLDSFMPHPGNHVIVMQASLILEDQTTENGCALVVPGSHRYGKYTRQEALRDAVSIESNAGDIVIWDSRIWHGTGENRTGQTRWSLVATFCRWWMKPQCNVAQNLPREIYEQLDNSQRAVLGLSIPAGSETTETVRGGGYDSVLPDVTGYSLR